jgi:hypothetical protein
LYRKAHRVLLLAEQHSDQILENLAGDLVETIVGKESMIEQLAAFERISNHDAQWWQSIHAGAEVHSGIKTSTPSLKVIKSSPRKKAALLLLGSVVLLVAAYALFLVFSPQVTGIIHGQKPKTATPAGRSHKTQRTRDTQRGEDGTKPVNSAA